MKQRVAKFCIFAMVILICCNCASQTKSPAEAKVPQDSEQAKKLLVEAQRLYGDGVIYNMRGEWSKARDSFDAALKIISRLDLEYCDNVSDELDALLREITYDYRFTISQSETLTVESAPVVLSLALSEAPFSDLTQKRLKQLMDELPMDTTGISHDYPIIINDRVKEKIVFFQTKAKKPLTRWLARSHRYLPMIEEVFSEHGLPSDLAYLPLIESGYNPNAYSWAHAVGIWQFIRSTAKHFGLEVNWWFDERRDPVKSTHAAAKYLKKLYNMFGDWHLALAAYNCGEGRVSRALKKQEVDNYWDLDLPTQTENYVPLFIAALLIAKNPQKYGFEVSESEKPLQFDVVYVDEVVDLKLAAKCANTTFDTLKLLNPELVRSCTPPKMKEYPLRVPRGRGKIFVEAYKKVPESEKVAWARHKVRKGESLWTIARRYGTSVQALIDANSVNNPKALRPGSYLIIPVDKITASNLAHSTKSSTSNTSYSYSTYIVKPGDTPSEIAQNLNISTASLLKANGMDENSIIRPGEKLKIPGSPNTEVDKKVVHTVKSGESLWLIARKYGVTVADIKKQNKLNSDKLSVGQKLTIGGISSGSYAKSNQTRTKVVHTVKSGESLWLIAKKYKVSVNDIKSWNKLDKDMLSIGEKILIYSNSEELAEANTNNVIHTVKAGETLWQIAREYGTDTDTIIEKNKIADPTKLKPGDRLMIFTQ
ncbi:hypothetical protein DRQ33_02885 [bacterium]|nr:MAG: hypothetical protein DRQ33_02885 [bacterium]